MDTTANERSRLHTLVVWSDHCDMYFSDRAKKDESQRVETERIFWGGNLLLALLILPKRRYEPHTSDGRPMSTGGSVYDTPDEINRTPSTLAASLGGSPSDVFTYALITDAETQP
eukprot:1740652-Prymnesium_polylepis.1